MKKIRINNDIDISLTVSRDGMVEDFTGKEIVLFLSVRGEEMLITEYAIEGNIISFRFPALEQTRLGAYSLTLQVKEGENINTVDKCNAFELVKSSYQIGGQDEPNIRTESVELSVNLDFNYSMGGGEIGKIKESIAATNTRIDMLVDGSLSDAIDNFKEVESFLQGIIDTESLTGMLTKEKQDLTSYVDKQIQTALTSISGQVDEISNLVGTDTEGGAV